MMRKRHSLVVRETYVTTPGVGFDSVVLQFFFLELQLENKKIKNPFGIVPHRLSKVKRGFGVSYIYT